MVIWESAVEAVEISKNFWKNKKVFLTGHTGFKGSWMSLWLLQLEAKVVGYSKDIPTIPSLFEEMKLEKDMHSITGDVRDLENLKKHVTQTNPDLVIHMAAQPLVRYSYQHPVETYMTNVMGTVHVLESALACTNTRGVLNVTSDKCYENFEKPEPYREDEPMGGYDPYSNSKGCSELVTSAYRKSFYQSRNLGLATGRAGNVIGGGDWAQDRLIPDIVRSVINNTTLEIRYPRAIRPWQHVLEPLSGYLSLAEKLYGDAKTFSKGYNFGPLQHDHCDVETIIKKMNVSWQNKIKYEIKASENNPHEAHYLKLDCTRAMSELGWRPRWSVDEALKQVVDWNIHRMSGGNVREFTAKQINEYVGQ